MGCDGGTIPTRDELVKTKKKAIKNPKDIEKAAKWNNCHLTQGALQKPIVADLLGNIYNKESMIEFLLERSKYEGGPEHVKGLKDVKELNLVDNPSYDKNRQETSDEFRALNKSQYICPVTGLEANGSFKFYFLFSCGCVFSERAYKAIENKSRCLKCEKEFTDNDLIVVNPSEEDIEINFEKLKLRKELAAKTKAEKKAAKNKTEASSSNGKDSEQTTTKNKKRSIDAVNGAASISKLPTGKNGALAADAKKPKNIQEDPNASDVYKSLFNTHEKAKNQMKGNWVTFNPQYF